MGNIASAGVLGFLSGAVKKTGAATAAASAKGGTSAKASSGTKSAAVYNREADPYFVAARDAAMAAADISTAPVYKNSYEKELNEKRDKMNAAPDFSYDMNTDPLFLQYKDSLTKSAQKAARDAEGRAAALTGGYGSSYSAAAGNVAYDNSINKLYDRLPDFYTAKYNEYSDRLKRESEEYDRLKALSDDEYKRYTDAVKAWQTNRDFYAKREDETFDRGIKTI